MTLQQAGRFFGVSILVLVALLTVWIFRRWELHAPDRELYELLLHDVELWNTWRKKNPDIDPNFSGLVFASVDIANADLRGARFWDATITDSNFNDTNLTDTQFDGASIQSTSFRRAVGVQASFYGSTLTDVSFESANLSLSTFWRANLLKVDFTSALLYRSSFVYIPQLHVIFNETRCAGIVFRPARPPNLSCIDE